MGLLYKALSVWVQSRLDPCPKDTYKHIIQPACIGYIYNSRFTPHLVSMAPHKSHIFTFDFPHLYTTSHWTKQSTWPRTVLCGGWCLCMVLRTT